MTDFYYIYEQQLRLARTATAGASPEDRRWGKAWLSPEQWRVKMNALDGRRAHCNAE